MTTNPYFEDQGITLYLADCLESSEWLSADVLITDPPYGMAYTGFGGRKGEPRRARGGRSIGGDENTDVRDLALNVWDPHRTGRPALVFGRWNLPRPEGTRQRIIWDKTPCGFMGDLSLPWGSAEEEIYVLGSGFTGRREANILRAPTLMSGDSRRPNHPTPKPVGLMETLIRKTKGVIADPFAGSGTTLLAARNLGREAVGIEIDEAYCELIAERLSQQAFDLGDVIS